MKNYYVYILTNKPRGVLYIGVANDLIRRVWEHKQKIVQGFTKKYNLHMPAYYETTNNIESAILREKQLKNWHRDWKINLIESVNQKWDDLYESVIR